MNTEIVKETIDLLENALENRKRYCSVIGLDGFIDRIIRVVQQRSQDGAAQYYSDIPSFARRIGHAAGLSTALELVTQQTKLGGNGPIMANAMANLGIDVTCIGTVGNGENIHELFQPMADKCEVISVGEAAHTDALEFNDGKLMLQKLECLDALDYDAVLANVGEDRLLQLLDHADLASLNNWSSTRWMSSIWRDLQENICPRLSTGKRRKLFLDLADPEKKSVSEIRRALELISGFEQWFNTTLGLNEKESTHISEALAVEAPAAGNDRELLMHRADTINKELGISCVTIHATAFAVATDRNDTYSVDGPFISKPLISTGAGDHFNSGFCFGLLLNGSIEQCLQFGVASSGYYVRTAESPTLEELKQFLANCNDSDIEAEG
jgi:sugar/nucleoside kinase (ribokinase family)